ncbi:MAG: ribosomal protein S18-alanine N-acetyltransferase [Porticoccaceae bacterium]|nr:ribosomal protein S18-alanine N-acetyltransferase [Porticoccaceae bacterium]
MTSLTEPPSETRIRPMCRDDLLQIVAIELEATPSPWSGVQFEQSLEQHSCLVLYDTKGDAEGDSKVVLGYAVVSTILDCAELLNICISPKFQGRGLGSQLLTHTLKQLADNIEVVYLEVRVSNFRAIHLYHNQGFREVGQRRDYYPTEFGREDAILMNLALPQSN